VRGFLVFDGQGQLLHREGTVSGSDDTLLKHMKAHKHLKPGENGTVRLVERFGDSLLCVRYRYDAIRDMRIKTAEIIVEERPGKGVPRIRETDTVLVPATFWGVVVGSFFTITGVLLTNRSNTNRLRIQLDHDREIKKEERELTLRKEIYLAADEAISSGIQMIGSIANLNVSYDKLMESFSEKAPAIAKVNVIANEDTIKALTAFMEELTSGLLRLSHQRIKLGAAQQKTINIQKLIDQASNERDRMVALMKEYNLTGSSDKHQWAIIQNNFEFKQKRIDELLEEKSRFDFELFSAQMQVAQESHAEIVVLANLLTPVIKSVRTELELPFNEASYAQVIESSQKKQTAYINQFITELTKDVEQLTTSSKEKLPNNGVVPDAANDAAPHTP